MMRFFTRPHSLSIACVFSLGVVACIATLTGCPTATPEEDDGEGGAKIAQGEYAVFAWNDLGMHCLNPTYDQLVILPPYNTVWVQVVKRGNPPEIVTAGLTVEYEIVNNTTSSDKRSYGQFWDNQSLFGATGLVDDTGLNLEDPGVHNGLSGTMLEKNGDHFQANGIPLVPVDDDLSWNPYQQILITLKDTASGSVLATTRATTPTSDEINCAKCHGTGTVTAAFQDIISVHNTNVTGENLTAPLLCASCHGSPALGTSGAGTSGKYLSEAIHGYHATVDPVPDCYDCHPGAITACSRSLAHTTADENCASCHGDLANVASTVTNDGRIPWVTEPFCASCHVSSSAATLTAISGYAASAVSAIPGVTTAALYRDSAGHGGVYCAACHGSPHAMVPSREAKDNYQSIQYQGVTATIGTCEVCHSTSHGGGFAEFFGEHGGSEGVTSACKVCHTGFPSGASAADAPHEFGWRTR